jgi:PII-like signaling protein
MSAPQSSMGSGQGAAPARENTVEVSGKNARLRIYVGEDKRHGDRPLYEAIVLKARQLQMAGATVVRGSLGYGRSTRLHTTGVVFSQDLPVIVEIIDSHDNIGKFTALLAGIKEIGLVTCDDVTVLLYPPIPASA